MTNPDEWARALDADGVIVLPALDNARALATRLREELELIGLALGHRFSKEELDRGYAHLDRDNSGTLDFEEFLEWWDMLKHGQSF